MDQLSSTLFGIGVNLLVKSLLWRCIMISTYFDNDLFFLVSGYLNAYLFWSLVIVYLETFLGIKHCAFGCHEIMIPRYFGHWWLSASLIGYIFLGVRILWFPPIYTLWGWGYYEFHLFWWLSARCSGSAGDRKVVALTRLSNWVSFPRYKWLLQSFDSRLHHNHHLYNYHWLSSSSSRSSSLSTIELGQFSRIKVFFCNHLIIINIVLFFSLTFSKDDHFLNLLKFGR